MENSREERIQNFLQAFWERFSKGVIEGQWIVEKNSEYDFGGIGSILRDTASCVVASGVLVGSGACTAIAYIRIVDSAKEWQ
ncbi:hypothetical protein Tco_1321018 [Tanacetum coccineum]